MEVSTIDPHEGNAGKLLPDAPTERKTGLKERTPRQSTKVE
jgi:hypothetical protein